MSVDLRAVTPARILAETLTRLAGRLAAEPGVDPGLVVDLDRAVELATGLDGYLERWSTPESADLRRLAARTADEDWSRYDTVGRVEPEMLSGHVEGQLLKTLVCATRARRVLEVGMFTGYAALAMAEALPPDGEVVACEIDPDVAAFAQSCFATAEHGSKIDVRVGPALATLRSLPGQVFDLIFIDADKAGYIGYLDAVLSGGLLATHGLVCVDNTLMQGQPWTAGASTPNGVAVHAFNQHVADDPRVEQVLLPLRDGVTLVRHAGGL